MIDLACPSCGRAGQIPPEKKYSRLVCKKCHVVFHMDSGGRPVIGEPHHDSSNEPRKHSQESEHHSIFEVFHLPKLDELTHLGDNLTEYTFPVKPVLGALGVLAVGWVVLGFLNGPPESVADRTRTAVDALAHDDLDRLKSFATENTRDDLIRWYDAAHAKLERTRKAWPGKESTVQVVVIEEDLRSQKGVVEAFILPAQAATQAASVIPTSGTNPPIGKDVGPAGPVAFHVHWVYSGKHWWLDGRQSLAVFGIQ